MADLGEVTSVPRPLIAVLAATVLVFVLYTFALKPGGSGGGGGSQSPGAYSSAIAKARAVQGVVNGAGARDGGTPSPTATTGTTTTTPGPSTTTTATTAGQAPAKTPSGASTTSHTPAGQRAQGSPAQTARASGQGTASATTAAARFHTVQVALQQHKVVALLFYNPSAPDDRAVESELSAIPTHNGAVVRLAVPLQEMSAYSSLLTQVPVDYSPTLVLINRQRQAEEITGYASTFELDQRVAGALRS